MITIVTGGAGFLGRHLVRALVERGRDVLIVDDFSTPGSQQWLLDLGLHPRGTRIRARESVRLGADALGWKGGGALAWLQVDLSQPGLLLTDPGELVDEIYHLASPASPPLYKMRQRETLRLGGHTLDQLLALAYRHQARLLFASSSEVYGQATELPTPESYRGNVSTTGPRSMYDEAKRYGEAMCAAWYREAGVDARIVRIHNCYDDQTEVLTDAGFVRFSELRGGELFATLHPETHAIEYHPASDYVASPFKGELIHFNGPSYDLAVTPNHRMWVDAGRGFEIMRADEVEASFTNDWRFMRGGARWEGVEQSHHTIPAFKPKSGPGSAERRIPMEDWCEFMGWFLSEGSAFPCGQSQYRIALTQYENVHPENYNRISSLVERMGFNQYKPSTRRDIYISSRQLYEELCRQTPMGSASKRIPGWMLQLSPKYLQRLFEALMLGDGHADGGTYSTVSRGLADDVCVLAIKLGMAASVRQDGLIYRVNIGQSRQSQQPRIGPNVKRVPYNGVVYDVTVPNHLLLVRRNGKTCWSGNTYGPGSPAADGRLVPRVIWNIMNSQPVQVHGHGRQTRSFCFVDDTIAGILAVMERGAPADPVNVGSDHEMTVLGLIQQVESVLGLKAHLQHTAPQDEHDPLFRRPDLTKLRSLGWEASIGIRDGIQRTASWMIGRDEQGRLIAG